MKAIVLTLSLTINLNSAATSENGSWGTRMVASAEAQRIKAAKSSEVVVAIIDTGGDIYHPDLKSKIWINKGETGIDAKGFDRSNNGIDDDGNGYIDDVHGWNFVENNSKLDDHHGHGTHIAGIISQTAPDTKLMFLKYFDPKSKKPSNMDTTVDAIKYAKKMGAKIINFSAGGLLPFKAEKSAIAEARKAGILFVTAAGNRGVDTDIFPYYPASYKLSNILAVAAVGKSKELLPISNFGRTVQIAAPGDAISSTLPHAQHGKMTGTSQATAFASGVAALLLAHSRLSLTPEECISRLINTGFRRSSRASTHVASVLNAHRALAIQGRDTITTNVGAVNPIFFSPQAAQLVSGSTKNVDLFKN